MIGVTRWIINRLPSQKVDVKQRLVTFDRASLFTLDDEGYDSEPRPTVYSVENVFEVLDTPGEWYLDRPQGRLYNLPRPGEDMQTAEVIAPRLTQVMRLFGCGQAPRRCRSASSPGTCLTWDRGRLPQPRSRISLRF